MVPLWDASPSSSTTSECESSCACVCCIIELSFLSPSALFPRRPRTSVSSATEPLDSGTRARRSTVSFPSSCCRVVTSLLATELAARASTETSGSLCSLTHLAHLADRFPPQVRGRELPVEAHQAWSPLDGQRWSQHQRELLEGASCMSEHHADPAPPRLRRALNSSSPPLSPPGSTESTSSSARSSMA